MASHRVRKILSAGAVLCCAAPAYAAGRDCSGYESALKGKPAVSAAKVSGGTKTHFIKSEMDEKACPADTKACRRKAFLVPGNGIVVSARTGDFVCATYVNGKGIETSGWLPKAAVTVEPPSADVPSGTLWPGNWEREEASIEIKVAKGKLAVSGQASWGAKDPDRVKRGAVNSGEISAVTAPDGDRLSFAMGYDSKTLPVDTKEETICKVWMQRVGDYLLVDDDNACGGMNVSFRGAYARRK